MVAGVTLAAKTGAPIRAFMRVDFPEEKPPTIASRIWDDEIFSFTSETTWPIL
jgi:hypothetical protein